MTNSESDFEIVEALQRRLRAAFDAGGLEAVGRELQSVGMRLRISRQESPVCVISEWLDERNHRQPLG